MDTSSEYIKQCEKAVEIQSQRRPTPDSSGRYFYPAELMDWYVCEFHYQILEPDGKYYSCYSCDSKHIWLPRQDQLQEMLLPDPNRKDAWGDPMPLDLKDDNVFWLFRDFADNIQERKWSQQTGEQLWLRCVMKKKFGKVWSGEDWAKSL